MRDPLFGPLEQGQGLPGFLALHAWANRNRRRGEDWNVARLFRTASEFLRDNRRRDIALAGHPPPTRGRRNPTPPS